MSMKKGQAKKKKKCRKFSSRGRILGASGRNIHGELKSCFWYPALY
jgi:hypothetical protein